MVPKMQTYDPTNGFDNTSPTSGRETVADGVGGTFTAGVGVTVGGIREEEAELNAAAEGVQEGGRSVRFWAFPCILLY